MVRPESQLAEVRRTWLGPHRQRRRLSMGDWPRPGQRVVSLSVPGHRCRLPPMCPRPSNASHHQPSPATDRRARPQPQRTPAIDYRQTLDYLVVRRSIETRSRDTTRGEWPTQWLPTRRRVLAGARPHTAPPVGHNAIDAFDLLREEGVVGHTCELTPSRGPWESICSRRWQRSPPDHCCHYSCSSPWGA